MPNPASRPARPMPDPTTRLVECACGTRSRVSSASGSTARCPSCRQLLMAPDPPVAQHESVPRRSPSSATMSSPDTDSPSHSINPPYRVHPNVPSNTNRSRTSIGNDTIIITAASCLIALILVFLSAIVWMSVSKDTPERSVVAVQEEVEPEQERAMFREGYSIILPEGFEPQSREETEQGYVVYRFVGEESSSLTFAIVPDESIDRFTTPPQDVSEALVMSVPELSEGIDAKIQPKRVTVNGIRATEFFYHEEETYRGVTFTYLMVAMDRGRKLVLKIAGKYGSYESHEEIIEMPDHWHDSLMSLRHEQHVETLDETEKSDSQTDDVGSATVGQDPNQQRVPE